MSTAQNVVVDQVVPTEQAVVIAEKKPRGRKPKTTEPKTDVDTKIAEPKTTEPKTDVDTKIAEPKTDVEKKTTEKKPRQKKEKKDPVVKADGDGEGEGEESKVEGEEEGETKEKKPKKPTLPAKFAKFIQFGLFLMKELNDERLIAGEAPLVDETFMVQKLCVFADVDVQKEFVQKFFDGAKDTAKTMRKMIADKKKADNKKPKVDKVKKPRQKKDKNNAGATNAEIHTDTIPPPNDLVAELVSLANTTDLKPKRKYTKKNNTTPTPINLTHNLNNNDNDNDNDNETEVDLILIDGKQFLCDDQSRIFHVDTHKLIGHLQNGLLVSL
jgi:hypothetical protein